MILLQVPTFNIVKIRTILILIYVPLRYGKSMGFFLFREYFISRVVNDERIFHEQAYIKTNMIKDVRGEKYSRPKYQ